MLAKIGSIIGFGIAVLGLLYLVLNEYIVSESLIISILQILSLSLMLWARITFKSRSFHLTANPTKGGLVTQGPYKLLRHPIYTALIYFGWICFIAFPKIEVLISVLLITIGLFVRMLLEEKELKKAYPEYVEYCRHAKRLIPLVF